MAVVKDHARVGHVVTTYARGTVTKANTADVNVLVVSKAYAASVLVTVVPVALPALVLDPRSIGNVVAIPALIGHFFSKDACVAFVSVGFTAYRPVAVNAPL
jgi:hypothetical protein